MSPIVSKLADVLGTVRRPGDFFVSGTIKILAPRLEVDGAASALAALPAERKGPTQLARMLTALTRLADAERIDAFLDTVIAGGSRGKDDDKAVLGALGILSQDRAAALLRRIDAGAGAASRDACGNLLAQAVAALSDAHLTDLIGAITAMVESLPGDPSRAPPPQPWRQDPGVQASFVVDLFNAAAAVDETLAMRAADHVLAWPKTHDLDAVVVPALRRLVVSSGIKDAAALRRLYGACRGHLRARVAEPAEPPRDWSRAGNLACPCAHCGDLKRFLADPERKLWNLKAAEAARKHVAETIRRARCDLDVATDRGGRPYGLVCTKNQASYDRRAKQHDQDLADLALLEGCLKR